MWVYFFLCTEAVSGDGMESAWGKMWVQSLLICKAHGFEPTLATFGEREAMVRTLSVAVPGDAMFC